MKNLRFSASMVVSGRKLDLIGTWSEKEGKM